jgi:hypothetical protein
MQCVLALNFWLSLVGTVGRTTAPDYTDYKREQGNSDAQKNNDIVTAMLQLYF